MSHRNEVTFDHAEALARTHTSETGASLIEVLVVIAVLIPVVLAATLGLLTSARLATATKVSQELNAAAASFGESLKEVAYVDCAIPSDFDDAAGLWAPPPDSSITIEIQTVEYWDQSSVDYGSSCPSTEEGAQRITFQLTDLDSDTRLTVVKRNPAGYPGAP